MSKIKIKENRIESIEELEDVYQNQIRDEVKLIIDSTLAALNEERIHIAEEVGGFDGIEELIAQCNCPLIHDKNAFITLSNNLRMIDSLESWLGMDFLFRKFENVTLIVALAYEIKLRMEAEKNIRTLTETFAEALKMEGR